MRGVTARGGCHTGCVLAVGKLNLKDFSISLFK